MGRKSRDRSHKKSSLSKRNGLSKKSMRFQVKPLDLTVANINYALNAAPLFAAAFHSQAEISGSSIYSFFVFTVALLGEAAKSFVTTEEEGDETLREAFSRSSRQALGHAWDRVIKEWGEEFPGISSDELEELKIDSYACVFQYDEKKETAHIDKSSIAADSIQTQINSLLRTRLNKDGEWTDAELDEISAVVTMSFFIELEKEIKADHALFDQLDMGEIKKRLDALEEEINRRNDADRIHLSREEVALLKKLYEERKKENLDFGKNRLAAAVSGFVRDNSIRRLSEDLWINWKTGVLAADFRSALAGEESPWRDAASGVIFDFKKEGKEHLLRLLSILVQAEGGLVDYKELDLRMVTMPQPENKEDTGIDIAERQRSLFMDMGDNSWYEYSENRIKKLIRDLRSISEKLAAIIDNPDSPDAIDGIALHIQLADADEHGTDEKSDHYRLYSDYIRHYCEISEKTDGSRNPFGQKNADSRNDIYKKEKRLAERDKATLRGAKDDNDRTREEYKQAWFRQYYAQSCHDFETDSMSAVGAVSESDAVKDMFGDYKMAQVYRNAYAAISASGREKFETQKERWTEQPDQYYHARTAAMLDYVESWFGQTDGKGKGRYGKVLVLHGQPGDGKTTFCKKAVYAHCKEGWLSGNITIEGKESGDKKTDDEAVETHVVRFSLNPADSKNEIHEDGLLKLEKGLCFMESKGSSEMYRITIEALKHALVIFDGYDELSSQLSGDSQANTFKLFCSRVLTLAQTNQFNAIITSRTMCIKDELEGDAVDGLSAVKAVSFAPMTVLQQHAMVNRMIVLSPEDGTKADLERYSGNSLPELRENENLNELMRIPSLFRMIVTLRFEEYETDTLAELYQKLVDKLFSYKALNNEEKKKLVESYERIAARIFLYNDDTCPFWGNADQKNRELLYRFLTKSGEGMSGHIGFLHRSFYQYFLARFIVSSIKNGTPRDSDGRLTFTESSYFPHRTEGSSSKEKLTEPKLTDPDLIDLVTIFRERKITDLDMWKLVMQVAEMERTESRNNPKPLTQGHIVNVLDWLEEEDNETRLMCEFHGVADECYLPTGIKKGLRALENVVYNLVGSVAAAEQGRCQGMDWEEFKRQSIRFGPVDGHHGYPNICRLLRRGDYREIYLAYLNFSGCDLSHARMPKAALADVFSDFAKERLDGRSMAGEGADLSNADLSGADLSGASMTRVNLTGARMLGINLRGAVLLDANLDGVNQAGPGKTAEPEKNAAVAKKSGKKEDRNTDTNLSGADLTRASFHGANLRGADLSGAWMADAELQDASLKGANLSEAVLTGAIFKNTDLEAANLSGAELSGVDREGALWLPQMIHGGIVTVHEEEETRTVDLLKEDSVPFGRYPQRKHDKLDKREYHLWDRLQWRVLRREYDKVLLITEDLIDCQVYNEDYVDITWEKSSLRRWLNGEFLLNAFTEEERTRIAWVCNQNPDNDYFDDVVEGGNPTWDRVFALSIYEVFRYFEDSADRRAPVTPYAEAKGSYISRGHGTGWWWLRSPGFDSLDAADVSTGGDVIGGGYYVDYARGSVRPALWLHL